MHRETTPGPLRNGNPRGNPNAAPRCGARTRARHPCRSPAMPNGRCRMHGGASTGPRTLEGLNRLRAANTRHGAYATSASRRARDPEDPFFLHSIATVLKGSHRLLALARKGGPTTHDPEALLALLRPDPLPFRRPRKRAPGFGETPCNVRQGDAGPLTPVSADAIQAPETTL
jgi:hypothetical protein